MKKYRLRILTLKDSGMWEYDEESTEYFDCEDDAISVFELLCVESRSPEVAIKDGDEYTMFFKWLPGLQKVYRKGEVGMVPGH